MAEVRSAARAMHLGARHAVAAVDRGLDRARHGIVEARPAGAALKFLLRFEQRLAAARAGKRAGALLPVERAGARPLRAVLAHDVILLRRQELAPFGVGMGYGIAVCVHRRLSRNVSIKPAARSATLQAPHSPFPRGLLPR